MNGFRAALWAETLKARRSRVPLFTFAGIAMGPLAGALFMIILKDPERARSMGLLGQKAQLVGVADWPTYLALLAQIVAVGGSIVFAIVFAWVFGREFSDRTAKDLLALPTSREAIVVAKTVVAEVWAGLLALFVLVLGMTLGAFVGIPGATTEVAWHGIAVLAVTWLLTAALLPWVGFFASFGRGYLGAMGWAILTVALAQIVAATGHGAWFPWAVAALYTGVAGPAGEQASTASFVLVAVTGALGLAATLAWWRWADQSR